jgi:hypothetical protein
MAELKRKFDEQFHNLEMETLQKKKDIEILQEKICKQQILAETFRVLHKASTGVASCSQIGTHYLLIITSFLTNKNSVHTILHELGSSSAAIVHSIRECISLLLHHPPINI